MQHLTLSSRSMSSAAATDRAQSSFVVVINSTLLVARRRHQQLIATLGLLGYLSGSRKRSLVPNGNGNWIHISSDRPPETSDIHAQLISHSLASAFSPHTTQYSAVNIDAVLSISPSSLSPVAEALICVVGGVANLLLLPLRLRPLSPLSDHSPLSYLIVVEPPYSCLNIFENDVHRWLLLNYV